MRKNCQTKMITVFCPICGQTYRHALTRKARKTRDFGFPDHPHFLCWTRQQLEQQRLFEKKLSGDN